MGKAVIVLISATAILACCVHGAFAGPLPTDPVAMPAWRGTENFNNFIVIPDISDIILDANVDYAVYAPGTFSTSAALGNPTDPSDGTQFVYAYQVFANPNGNRPVEFFSVGFLDAVDGVDELEQPQNIGFLSGLADPPSAPVSGFSPDNAPETVKLSALWEFPINGGLDPAIPANSDVLFYTSPFGPEWDVASVQGGGLSASESLPSPIGIIPEPATLALALLAAAAPRLPPPHASVREAPRSRGGAAPQGRAVYGGRLALRACGGVCAKAPGRHEDHPGVGVGPDAHHHPGWHGRPAAGDRR